MMTKQSSRKRIYMLMAGVVPVVIALIMMLGQPVVAQSEAEQPSDAVLNAFMANTEVKIPNSFSPNGDGKSETLKPFGQLDRVKEFALTIYNKFGEIMYKSNDPSEAWNGKKNNSEGNPVGDIYVYSMSYTRNDGTETKENGDVILIMDPDQMINVVNGTRSKKVKISEMDTIPTPPPTNRNLKTPKPPKSPRATGTVPLPITKDRFFKNAIIHFKATDGKVMVKSYNTLPTDVKDLLPPPPPFPPALPGEKQGAMQPLEKGTIVHLKPNGSIVIGDNARDIDYPMPPPPPPPPPKAPKSFKVIDGQDMTYRLDDKEISRKEMKAINDEDVERIDIIRDSNSGNIMKIYSKNDVAKLSFSPKNMSKVIMEEKNTGSSIGDTEIEYILDGKVVDEKVIEDLVPGQIETLDIFKKEGSKTQIKVTTKIKGQSNINHNKVGGVNQLIEQGANVYINGNLVSKERSTKKGLVENAISYQIIKAREVKPK